MVTLSAVAGSDALELFTGTLRDARKELKRFKDKAIARNRLVISHSLDRATVSADRPNGASYQLIIRAA
jgi:hypothetical protein